MTDVDLGRGDVDAELDPQRPALLELPLELAVGKDVDGVPREILDDAAHGGRFSAAPARQPSFGTARAVIARPATRMTSALSAGSKPMTRPSKRTRLKARLARTATSPTPVIESARPALNATISSSPNATRWREIAARRTTSAEGHGRSPPDTPTPTSDRQSSPAA